MSASTINIHQAAHLASTRQLYGTGEYSDLLLCCRNGRKFRVHRSVLCPRSRFFSKACGGNFSEATTGTINLADDDPDTVARMLEYLYTLDYDDGDGLAGVVLVNDDSETHHHLMSDGEEEEEEEEEEKQEGNTTGVDGASPSSSGSSGSRSALQNNALVYALAEKYEIVELKSLAIERFNARAGAGGGTGFTWLSDDFSDIVRAVYEMTPDNDRGLRDVLTEICAENLSDQMLDSDDFKNIAAHFGVFCLDLLRHVRKVRTWSREQPPMENFLRHVRKAQAYREVGGKRFKDW